MRYQEPYGASDPNAGYINGNPATGTAGSIPPAGQMELPQREIVNAITASGQTPSDNDLFQLWKAMQKAGGIRYAQDTGSSDSVVVSPVPALQSYASGVPVLVRIVESNTGPATIDINGLGERSIVRKGGAALSPNDLVAASIALVVYDGTNFQLMNYGSSSGGGGGGGGGGTIVGGDNIGDGTGTIFAGVSGDDTLWFRTVKEGDGVKIETVGNEVIISLDDIAADLTDLDFATQHLAISTGPSLADLAPIDARFAFMRVLFAMGFTDFVSSASPPIDRSVLWWYPAGQEARRYNGVTGNWFALTPAQFALHLHHRAYLAATGSATLAAGDLFLFWDAAVKETKSISRDNLIAYFSTQQSDYVHSESFFLGMM